MVDFIVINSIDELPKFSIDEPTFSDIETDGLYINTRLIQVYQPATSDTIFIIDTDIINLEAAKAWIKPLWTIWWNQSYDFGTLNMTTDRFDDLIYLAKTAYPGWMDYKLDNAVAKLGHNHLYDGLDKKALQKAGFVRGAYLSRAQLRYSATDVYALSLIWLNKNIQTCRNILAYKVDILSARYAIQYQENGLIVHQPSVRKELDDIEDIIESNYVELDGLNPNSPKQVKEFLGTESSSKDILIHLISEPGPKQRIAKLVYDQRRLLKRRTMLHSYNFPIVKTRFNVAGAITGRFTATGGDLPNGINAQQIPRDLQYIFNQPSEDTIIIEADFGTAELRAAAAIMGEEVMYNELMNDIDLHKVSAIMVNGKNLEDITKDDRLKGKAVSFGFIFGMSAPSFKEYAFTNYGVIFTDDEAKQIKAKYVDHYPNIAKYHIKAWNSYKDEDYFVTTALGRRAKPRMGTDAINIPTQGTIAETTKLSIHYCVLENPKILEYIYNVVHDQINIRVPKTEVEYWKELLVRNMEKGWTEICKTPLMKFKNIPMPVDSSHGD